jgi:hypothetical protein
MVRTGRGVWAGLVIGAGLLLPGGTRAGDVFGWWPWKKSACPPSSYSPCHYWTPTCYRLDAYCHPHGYIYPPDRYPHLPPHYLITQFPCMAVDPTTAMGGTSYAHLYANPPRTTAAAADTKPAADGAQAPAPAPEQLTVPPKVVP